MNIIALLVARKGSTRIPRKNVQPFCGKPLIEWTFEHVKNSEMINYAYIYTDDEEVESIARQHGITVLDRDDESFYADGVSAGIATNRAYWQVRQYHDVIDGVWTGFSTGPLKKPNDSDRLIKEWIKRGKPTVLSYKVIPKDLFVYYRINHLECLPVVREKATRYLLDIPTMGIAPPNAWENNKVEKGGENPGGKMMKSQTTLVRKQDDPKHSEDYADFPFTVPVHYMLGELWQAIEIDVWDEFYMAEHMMQTMLINKYGRELYEEYGQNRTEIT